MTYSRGCGVDTATCAANECRCVSVDPGSEIVPENGAQQCTCDIETDWSPDQPCAGIWTSTDDAVWKPPGCCEVHMKRWGHRDRCAVHNPLQTTHNKSREDC